MNIILGYLGEPSVIIRVLISGKGRRRVRTRQLALLKKIQTAIAGFEDGRGL